MQLLLRTLIVLAVLPLVLTGVGFTIGFWVKRNVSDAFAYAIRRIRG
jgi:hypothetical protein